jgi:hypothetical protein
VRERLDGSHTMAPGSPGSRPVVVGIALLVSAGLAGGAAYALVDVSDDKGTTTATGSPLVGSTPAAPVETPSAPPVVLPTATATPAVRPTPSLSASPSPSSSPKPSRTSTAVTRYPFPSNPGTAAGLRFTASSQAQGYSTTTTITITATDGDGDITFGGLTWGDGTSMGPEAVPGTCPAYPSPTAAPGRYQPRGDKRTFTYSHTYATDQDYTINLTVKSGNDACRPHGPAAESRSAALRVHFAGPSPTPSPAATE